MVGLYSMARINCETLGTRPISLELKIHTSFLVIAIISFDSSIRGAAIWWGDIDPSRITIACMSFCDLDRIQSDEQGDSPNCLPEDFLQSLRQGFCSNLILSVRWSSGPMSLNKGFKSAGSTRLRATSIINFFWI